MFDRVCELGSAERPASRSARSHTPKHKTITRCEADAVKNKNLSHKHRHICCSGMKTCLLSYSIIKRKQAWKPQSHSFPPWHPTPITLTLSLSYLPPHLFCQLLHYSFPSLLGHFSCSSVPLTSALCTNPLMTLSLSLSLHLIWAAFFFISPPSAWKWIGGRKKKKKEKKRKSLRRPNLYRAKHLHGCMTPWNSPSCSTALQKGWEGRGRARRGVKGRESERAVMKETSGALEWKPANTGG